MNLRTGVKISLAVLVLVASLSTARARQLWTESQARSGFEAARNAANAALRHASSVGLLPAELATYRSQANRLGRLYAPSSAPFWGSDVERFYDRQANRYRVLTGRINRAVRWVTTATRLQAQRDLQALKGRIEQAKPLDVDSSAGSRVLGQEVARFNQSSLPKEFRAISASAMGTAVSLQNAIAQQQSYASSLVSQVGGTKAGVVGRASAEIASVQPRLSLLGALTSRATTYNAALSGELQEVKAAGTAFSAAVKESHIHAELATITADYERTVPNKMVVVSTEDQSATMYERGRQVYATPVTTGGPELPTDHGVFHIYMKVTPWVFHSPWPPDSPYYYPPTPITYWMPFDGGEGLHDAWWRGNFGPGSNLQPTDLGTGNSILGTHGCVNMPMAAAQFVWDWAPLGTTVVVI